MAMIETVNLTKRYGDFVALESLNLSIEEGDCYGFIGPNGAGKTTTIKILATLLKPSSGQATIDGLTIGFQNRQIRPLIGYVPDFMGAYDDMLVEEYLQFFAAAYGIHGEERDRVVRDVLELTELGYKAGSQVNALSRGMSQRLSVARVLLHDPKVLLLDEPASGLDPRARIEMRELLKELKRMGKTILISSHILHELAELCNVVGIIERGKLLYTGTVRDALNRARVGQVLHLQVVERSPDAAEILKKLPGVKKADLVDTDDGVEIHLTLDQQGAVAIADVPSILINHGFRLKRFTEEAVNLETAFMRLTKGLVQ